MKRGFILFFSKWGLFIFLILFVLAGLLGALSGATTTSDVPVYVWVILIIAFAILTTHVIINNYFKPTQYLNKEDK